MSAPNDLTARIERIEQILEDREMSRDVHPLWDRIPFSAWLKISGPTFAVMALGFGLLWNSQQETTRRILELEQSTTDRILELQRETTAQIMQLQQETTAQIMQLQRETTDRILGLQQQIVEIHREAHSG